MARSTDWSASPVTVITPATCANLGPGFDSFGLALDLANEVVAEVVERGLQVEVEGEGAAELMLDESHLVVRAARATFDVLGGQPPGLRISCRDRVPHARGLGSSAAAIAAGVVAARALVVGGGDLMSAADALRLAASLEGHADNVAAAVLGGVTVAWMTHAGARAVRLESHVGATVLVPQEAVLTRSARSVLPSHVPHADAAHNAARAGLLVAALTGRSDLLLDATEDRLHQEHRRSLLPRSLALVDRLRSAGHAAVVSGAGPSVLVLHPEHAPPDDQEPELRVALATGWNRLPTKASPCGARVRA